MNYITDEIYHTRKNNCVWLHLVHVDICAPAHTVRVLGVPMLRTMPHQEAGDGCALVKFQKKKRDWGQSLTNRARPESNPHDKQIISNPS